MKRLARFVTCLFLVLAPAVVGAEGKRPMKLDDLFRFLRVSDPQISPDGKHVVYQVTTVSLEQNKSSTSLWLAATDGKTPPRQLTNTTKADGWVRARVTGRRGRGRALRDGGAPGDAGPRACAGPRPPRRRRRWRRR